MTWAALSARRRRLRRITHVLTVFQLVLLALVVFVHRAWLTIAVLGVWKSMKSKRCRRCRVQKLIRRLDTSDFRPAGQATLCLPELEGFDMSPHHVETAAVRRVRAPVGPVEDRRGTLDDSRLGRRQRRLQRC